MAEEVEKYFEPFSPCKFECWDDIAVTCYDYNHIHQLPKRKPSDI